MKPRTPKYPTPPIKATKPPCILGLVPVWRVTGDLAFHINIYVQYNGLVYQRAHVRLCCVFARWSCVHCSYLDAVVRLTLDDHIYVALRSYTAALDFQAQR